MTNLHTRIEDNLLTITLDCADKPVNTMTPRVFDELEDALIAAEQTESLRGVIFASAKADMFIAGADLGEMSEMDRDLMERFLERGQEVYERIERLKAPTVAAINGTCLGGGFELALACDYRVAADSGAVRIGLPEVGIGILPAWGGTTRMVRRIGLATTLPIMLAGKTLPPRKAKRVGMIDEVVRPISLHAAAKRLVTKKPAKRKMARIDRLVQRVPGMVNHVCNRARKETLAKTCGNYPAPERLIDVARIAMKQGHRAGLDAERRAAIELAQTDTCRNLMRLFFLRSAAKKQIKQAFDVEPAPVQRAAVIGGGAMGAGIVHALIRADIPVRLIEVSPEAAGAGLKRVRKMLDSDARSKRISRLEADAAMRRVSVATALDANAGLSMVDIVIEAVAERIDIKQDVFRKLAALTRPDTVLASNTSSLPITDIAAAIEDDDRRARVVGLHFFNPVPKMPLVEVVRTEESCDEALALAAALALRIGKTPVLTADTPGFVVNRVLIPYLAEAMTLAAEGVAIDRIDDRMRRFGMPMGPIELIDQVGLDIAVAIFDSVGVKLGEHLTCPAGLDSATENNWFGKKTGRGFYIYEGKAATPPINDELIDALTRGRPSHNDTITDEDITWRLMLPMINEAARLLEQRVTDSTDMLDLATVLGLGLAPFRGGLVRFAETEGLANIITRMDAYTDGLGPRFAPTRALRRVAEAKLPMQAIVDDAAPDARPVNGHTTSHTPATTPTK